MFPSIFGWKWATSSGFFQKRNPVLKGLDNLISQVNGSIDIYQRIDTAFEISNECQRLLENAKDLSSAQMAQIQQLRNNSFEYLKMTLNVSSEVGVQERMAQRNAVKEVDPYYLPKKLPSGISEPKVGEGRKDFVKRRMAEHFKHIGQHKRKFIEEDYKDEITQKDHYGVQYLKSNAEREKYRVIIKDGQLYRTKQSGFWIFKKTTLEPLDTKEFLSFPRRGFGNYVINSKGEMFVGRERVGDFHHSTYMQGAPIIAAGMIQIIDGQVRIINPESGHYKPSNSNLREGLTYLSQQSVDLSRCQAEYFRVRDGKPILREGSYMSDNFICAPATQFLAQTSPSTKRAVATSKSDVIPEAMTEATMLLSQASHQKPHFQPIEPAALAKTAPTGKESQTIVSPVESRRIAPSPVQSTGPSERASSSMRPRGMGGD